MKYQVIKLDNRYSHRDQFKYMLEFSRNNKAGTGVRDYDQSCRWFNDHFGWSQDIDVRTAMIHNWTQHHNAYTYEDFNPIWAYCARYSEYRIYVATDKELEWYLLCHPQT